jgi:hypothetical protein
MRLFKQVNNITGWIVFTLALILYLVTLEPSVSLWDCGEFLSASYKLEVGHPPGAPLYLMLGRIFALFSPDKAHVAIFINSLSAFASAFTILFLFWIITHLARKIILKDEDSYTRANVIAIIGSGVVGALTFCVSDSFWFSAVEAEVYALSSLFTALVFWCILKWEEDTGVHQDRWLVLIAYLMGLSIGAHLLNLLALPAIVMIYYYRKFHAGWKRSLFALMVSFLLLVIILYLIVPGTLHIASLFEVVSVNSFHFPVNSGLIVFIILFTLLIAFGLWYTRKKQKVITNTVLLFLAVILIGYSSYAMILIRACANPPINTNNPDNVFSLLYYLNRDQYSSQPIFYGPYYNAPVLDVTSKKASFSVSNGKYEEISLKKDLDYDSRFMTVFPRMYSNNANHIDVYKGWGSVRGVPLKVMKSDGSSEIVMKPTFLDNLEFFFKYQVGYMYMRYFMWNFAGKQNDLQGNGGIFAGNWISGFDFIDKWMIGPQNSLPAHMKDNTGRNRYFLPLILGIGGMLYHFSKSRKYFLVVSFLFILTGFAIVVYTNQTPLQPRERDYVYVGSFFAFSIWIGLGVLWISSLFKRKFSTLKTAAAGFAIAAIVPAEMFFQNLDDHSRNGRFVAREIAYNYLINCDPNSIVFTAGDNDTYPLWYLQEVEGIRTDVRVVNLMLMNTDWYINQLKNRWYQSDPLPISLSSDKYSRGKRNWVSVYPNTDTIAIEEAIKSLADDSSKYITGFGTKTNYISSSYLRLSAGRESDMIINLSGSYIGKNEMIMLDILANFKWQRSLYFTSPSVKGTLGLKPNMALDGFCYRLTPQNTGDFNVLNTEELYRKLMINSKWESLANKNVNLDDHLRNMISIMRVRQNYGRLALALAEEGKYDKGVEVLDRVMEITPPERIPYDYYCAELAEAYYKCHAVTKGNAFAKAYLKQINEELTYYNQLPSWMKSWVRTEKSHALYYKDELEELLELYGKR